MGSNLQASSIVELGFPKVSSNSQPEFPVISFPIRLIRDNLFFQLNTSIYIPRGRCDQFANLGSSPNKARSFISCMEWFFRLLGAVSPLRSKARDPPPRKMPTSKLAGRNVFTVRFAGHRLAGTSCPRMASLSMSIHRIHSGRKP